jgi:hypothetical protein
MGNRGKGETEKGGNGEGRDSPFLRFALSPFHPFPGSGFFLLDSQPQTDLARLRWEAGLFVTALIS